MTYGPSPTPQPWNRVKAVTTPSFPATTVYQQNTTGFDVLAVILLPSVTQTHIYVANATGGTDVDFTASCDATATSEIMSLIIPANCWFSMTYSAGAPVWKWMGLS